jgi:alpha-1,3-rhamnosyl/mannosyltransferase
VACSNVSSLPEVVGDAALTFDPHSVEEMAAAMGRAMADEALRRTMIARGSARAGEFTWRRCANQVLRVLESVGQGGNGP